jgi:hypothetical protein
MMMQLNEIHCLKFNASLINIFKSAKFILILNNLRFPGHLIFSKNQSLYQILKYKNPDFILDYDIRAFKI